MSIVFKLNNQQYYYDNSYLEVINFINKNINFRTHIIEINHTMKFSISKKIRHR